MNAVIDANAVVGGSQQCKGELVELDLLLKDPCTEGGKEEEKEVPERESRRWGTPLHLISGRALSGSSGRHLALHLSFNYMLEQLLARLV